jgi:peptidoglycan L-alanyl-D-glutamate endopeptidase CwlK
MLPDTEEQLRGRGVDLEPETAHMVDLAESIMKQHGVKGKRTSGRRTDAEQIALHAQGRKLLPDVNALRKTAGLSPIGTVDNSYVVTECDGVKDRSPHQDGRAMDYTPVDSSGAPVWPGKADPRWLAIAECFELAGLTWGGRWTKFPDYPHYERSLA